MGKDRLRVTAAAVAALVAALPWVFSAQIGCSDDNALLPQVVGYYYDCYRSSLRAGTDITDTTLCSHISKCIAIADMNTAISECPRGCFVGSPDGTQVAEQHDDVHFTGTETNTEDKLDLGLQPIIQGCVGKTLTTSNVLITKGGGCSAADADACGQVIELLGQAKLKASGHVNFAQDFTDPANPTFHPTLEQCLACEIKFHSECTSTEKPTECCTDPTSDLCPPGVATRSASLSSYSASLVSTQSASLQDLNDNTKQGYAVGEPTASLFSFDRSSTGLTINALRLSFSDFIFDGTDRKQGSAVLVNNTTASPAGPGAYTIAGGAAKFSVVAIDDQGNPFGVLATNVAPLTISGVDDWSGPHISGTLTGAVSTHTVQADLDAPLNWINRPPVAVATAANVQFHSSQMEPCLSNPADPACVHTNCDGTHWIGLKNAKAEVLLDGSASYDPDPGDTLLYSWDLKVESNGQPVARVELPQGWWTANLVVQDQHGASAVASVPFLVKDLDARPNFCREPMCGNGICEVGETSSNCALDCPRPKKVTSGRFASFTDPTFNSSQLDAVSSYVYTQSTQSNPVTKANKSDIKASGAKGIAKIYKAAASLGFGAPDTSQTPPDPFAGACDNPDGSPGTAMVCTGACGNGRCEKASEDCLSCAADCGACTRCGDGRCDLTNGETCTNCQKDCGECAPCGNGRCDPGETVTSCPADCYCGDGLCEQPDEYSYNCSADCYCGDGKCESDETRTSCPVDCRCGDGICDASEGVFSCPQDCTCGNGTCDANEGCGTCPADCGICPRTVFVTATYVNGADIGALGGGSGLAGGDTLCMQEAQAAGLAGTYKAWLSDSTTSAASRLTHSAGHYDLVDGTRVANDWTDLTDGSIANPITLTATGVDNGFGGAWTATTPAGNISFPGNTCNNWTSGSSGLQGADGYIGAPNGDWSQNSVQPLDFCSVHSRLYCFQQ